MHYPASHEMSSATSEPHADSQATGVAPQITSVSILSLRPGDPLRLNGVDKAHIARLAEAGAEATIPPILVDRRTMRVIDGMHRLMAASLVGRETIDVMFFDGSEAEAFLHAVHENVTHGLPLSLADRRYAAERIISSHPHLSDRAIARVAGLAAKTVAGIRKHSADGEAPSGPRLGRDGKVHPLDSADGRKRAADLLTRQPETSLRDVARACDISPATALDVRRRIERGEPAVPARAAAADAPGPGASDGASARVPAPCAPFPGGPRPEPVAQDPAASVEKLLRDPSLRNNERGKGVLRLLHANAVGAEHLVDVARAVPPHCVTAVALLARHYATMWQGVAQELDGRSRIIDPSAAAR